MTTVRDLRIPEAWTVFVYLNFLFTKQADGTWTTVKWRATR